MYPSSAIHFVFNLLWAGVLLLIIVSVLNLRRQIRREKTKWKTEIIRIEQRQTDAIQRIETLETQHQHVLESINEIFRRLAHHESAAVHTDRAVEPHISLRWRPKSLFRPRTQEKE